MEAGPAPADDTTALFDIHIQTAPPAEMLREIIGYARSGSAGA